MRRGMEIIGECVASVNIYIRTQHTCDTWSVILLQTCISLLSYLLIIHTFGIPCKILGV